MPGRDIIGLLKSEAKRRPEIAALIEKVHGMTDAEIKALKVPLPWYRHALKLVRDMNIQIEETGRLTDLIVKRTHIVYLNDVGFGSMRQWAGPDTFITVSKSGTSIELRTGQYVWFPESGGVWLDTVFSQQIDPQLANSTFIERNRRSDYIDKVAELRRGKEFTGAGEVLDTDNRGWFRIQRN